MSHLLEITCFTYRKRLTTDEVFCSSSPNKNSPNKISSTRTADIVKRYPIKKADTLPTKYCKHSMKEWNMRLTKGRFTLHAICIASGNLSRQVPTKIRVAFTFEHSPLRIVVIARIHIDWPLVLVQRNFLWIQVCILLLHCLQHWVFSS